MSWCSLEAGDHWKKINKLAALPHCWSKKPWVVVLYFVEAISCWFVYGDGFAVVVLYFVGAIGCGFVYSNGFAVVVLYFVGGIG